MAGGTQYLFAVGRVKAKEEEIIDSQTWQRLIDAGTDNKAGGVEQEGVILGHVYILGQRYYLIVNLCHSMTEE